MDFKYIPKYEGLKILNPNNFRVLSEITNIDDCTYDKKPFSLLSKYPFNVDKNSILTVPYYEKNLLSKFINDNIGSVDNKISNYFLVDGKDLGYNQSKTSLIGIILNSNILKINSNIKSKFDINAEYISNGKIIGYDFSSN